MRRKEVCWEKKGQEGRWSGCFLYMSSCKDVAQILTAVWSSTYANAPRTSSAPRTEIAMVRHSLTASQRGGSACVMTAQSQT